MHRTVMNRTLVTGLMLLSANGAFAQLPLPFAKSAGSVLSLFAITNTGAGDGLFGKTSSTSTLKTGAAGVHGVGGNGVMGVSPIAGGNGVVGVAQGGVTAYGVWGVSDPGVGVAGDSISGAGVSGASETGTGVYGAGSPFHNEGFLGGLDPLYGYGCGVFGDAGAASPGDKPTFGVFGYDHTVRGSIAVHGESVNGTGVSAVGGGVGLHASSFNGTAIYGQSDKGYAGFFAGAVVYTGALTHLSDARYKTDVADLSNALDSILNLRGVTYRFDQAHWPNKSFPAGREIGFIAQEVEQVLPDVVVTDKEGYKSVAYQNVIPVLVEAVKTQQKQIDGLNARVQRLAEIAKENAELKQQLTALAAAVHNLESKQIK